VKYSSAIYAGGTGTRNCLLFLLWASSTGHDTNELPSGVVMAGYGERSEQPLRVKGPDKQIQSVAAECYQKIS